MVPGRVGYNILAGLDGMGSGEKEGVGWDVVGWDVVGWDVAEWGWVGAIGLERMLRRVGHAEM